LSCVTCILHILSLGRVDVAVHVRLSFTCTFPSPFVCVCWTCAGNPARSRDGSHHPVLGHVRQHAWRARGCGQGTCTRVHARRTQAAAALLPICLQRSRCAQCWHMHWSGTCRAGDRHVHGGAWGVLAGWPLALECMHGANRQQGPCYLYTFSGPGALSAAISASTLCAGIRTGTTLAGASAPVRHVW
jgi:hypothetical protein